MPQRILKIPKDEARRLFRQQIEAGRQLERKPVTSPEELQDYKRERAKYTKYNIEMLTSMFGEDEDAFWRYELSRPRDGAYLEDALAFYREWDAKQLDELIALEASLDLMPVRTDTHTPREGTRLPEKVSLEWLYHNVPYTFWLTLAGAFLTAFTLGVTTGQTTLVRQLLGKESAQNQQKSSASYIYGEVRQNGGYNLGGSEVTVINDRRQVVYGTFTDLDGNYKTPNLTHGSYTVTFKNAGYETVVREIYLNNGESLLLSVGLDRKK